MNRTRNEMRFIPLRLILLAGLSLVPFAASAQGLDDEDSQPRRQFSVSEEGPRLRPSTETDLSKETEAPVRLARFRYVEGNVSWREDDKASWSNATLHLPIRQGAQIWVEGKGRAEIQFDDGSLLRVGRDTLVTLQTLFSDMEGTFTEIKLHEGLLGLRLKHKLALYQIDSPFASLKATGPARIRAGARQESEFAVQEGEATVENEMGSVKMRRGDYLALANTESALETGRIPSEDSWDKWNRERDREQDNLESRPSQKYLPPNVSIVTDDLDRYGRWDQDSEYGNVWYPSVSSVSWRPYNDGSWVWVRPFGWTWVSNEPWGWAPYHYGSWVCRQRGWAWVPGRQLTYWSPAVVNFCHLNNRVVWVPLCPNEIVLPLRVSARSLRLAQHFSIVTAGVYYPTSSTACGFRPWSSQYTNRRHHSDDRDTNRYANNRQPTAADRLNFRPRNLRDGAGATMTNADSFGRHGAHQAVSREMAGQWDKAQGAGLSQNMGQPLAGPAGVRPSQPAIDPTRIERKPREGALRRETYRAPLPAPVQRVERENAASRLNGRRDLEGVKEDKGRTPNTLPTEREGAGRRTREELSPNPERAGRRTREELSPSDAARKARETVKESPLPREREGRREETPRREEPRRESPLPQERERRREQPETRPAPIEPPRREEPRRESPLPQERERRREEPRREEPRREEPRREEPRRESPLPQERRREEPRRQEPPQRQEPPRREEPRRQEPPQRQEPPRREEPRRQEPPQRQETPRREEPRRDPSPSPTPRERDRRRP